MLVVVDGARVATAVPVLRRVHLRELGQIEDEVVDDDPAARRRVVVLSDLRERVVALRDLAPARLSQAIGHRLVDHRPQRGLIGDRPRHRQDEPQHAEQVQREDRHDGTEGDPSAPNPAKMQSPPRARAAGLDRGCHRSSVRPRGAGRTSARRAAGGGFAAIDPPSLRPSQARLS